VKTRARQAMIASAAARSYTVTPACDPLAWGQAHSSLAYTQPQYMHTSHTHPQPARLPRVPNQKSRGASAVHTLTRPQNTEQANGPWISYSRSPAEEQKQSSAGVTRHRQSAAARQA
jgi:hypothetical protein